MRPDGDRPMLGTSSRTLGIRLPPSKHADISELNEDGTIEPGKGGLSVSPGIGDLPKFLVPNRLGNVAPGAKGDDNDICWSIGTGPFASGPVNDWLTLRVDRPNHGLIEPAYRMPVTEFVAAIAATRDHWKKEA
jgi:hypothetical protein